MASRQGYAEHPDQFKILENRLKTVDAEKQALFDLNASLQDENGALKRLALHHDQGGMSFLIFAVRCLLNLRSFPFCFEGLEERNRSF